MEIIRNATRCFVVACLVSIAIPAHAQIVRSYPKSAVNSLGTSTTALSAPSYSSSASATTCGFTFSTANADACWGGATTGIRATGDVFTFFSPNYGPQLSSGALINVSGVISYSPASLPLKSQVADGATAVGVKIGNVAALSTAGSKAVAVYSDNVTTEVASIRKDAATWGIRLRSPDGTWYLLTIANGGTVSIAASP
jgi:hypothetical protein